MSYLMQGAFPLREGIMSGFPDWQDQGILLSWGLWEQPQAENDEHFQPPPVAA